MPLATKAQRDGHDVVVTRAAPEYDARSLRHPEHAALIARVLAIPTKRCDNAEVSYLVQAEADALVAAPDRRTWTGRRDHALLDVALQTGLSRLDRADAAPRLGHAVVVGAISGRSRRW